MPDYEIQLAEPFNVTEPGFYRAVPVFTEEGSAWLVSRCAEQAPGPGRFPLKAGEVIVAARFRSDGGEPYRSGQAVSLLSTQSARAQAAGSHTDNRGRLLVRRTDDGHLIAVADPDLADENGVPWNLVYVQCMFADKEDACETCRPHCGPWIDPSPRGIWLLTGDEVAKWPVLDLSANAADWYRQQLEASRQAVRGHQQTYGEMSAKLGATRAELARARERIRALSQEAAVAATPKPCKHLTTQADSAGRWHCSGCGDIVPVGAVGDPVDRLAQFGGYSRAEVAELRREAAVTAEAMRKADGGHVDALREPQAGGCRLVDTTWVHHGEPHTCPVHVRGKR